MIIDFSDGIGFQEAIDYAVKRKVVLPENYYGKLIGVQRAQATTVAGLASLEQIKFIIDQLSKVMADGGTLNTFQEAVKAGGLEINLPQYRLDNIFRTNIQAAYSRGRWEQQMRVRGTRPYLMYDSINDSRTRPAHHAMDNIILKWDDPFWKTNYPTNGYRCRCTVISLSDSQAKKRGIPETLPDPATTKPDAGWDYNPGEGYSTGPNVGVARTVEKIKKARPSASAKADKVAKKIAEETVSAGPATLEGILARGHAALAELPPDPKEFNTAFEKLLMTKVLKVKYEASAVKNRAAVTKYAEEAMGGMQPTMTGLREAGFGSRAYLDAFYRALPIPKSWIKATAERYPSMHLANSGSRAFADQTKGLLSININMTDVVLHEFLHLVQVAVPEVETLAREMHLKRTAGSRLRSLAELTQIPYDAQELTREDSYFDPYVGKEYNTRLNGQTYNNEPLEILTMTIQALIGSVGGPAGKAGANASRNALLSRDRESAAFALGLLLHYA